MVRLLEGWLEKMDDDWEVIHTNSVDYLNKTDEPCECSRTKNDGREAHIEERCNSEVEGGHANACENEEIPHACHCIKKNMRKHKGRTKYVAPICPMCEDSIMIFQMPTNV